MSDDHLDDELRATLDEQARTAPRPHEAGPAVAKARRRRGLAVAAGALGAAVVVVAVVLAAGALRSPSGGGPADPGPSSPSAPPSTPVPTATPTNVPDAVQPVHGGEVWGLYLAVGDDLEAPAMQAAREQAAALGYEAGGGELACDQPAAEELGVAPDAFAVSLYFATRADAQDAAILFDPPPVGIVRVMTYCLD
jgi:hypothetical protein